MLWLVIALLMVSLSLAVLRMILGPTMIDRLVAVNLFGTMVVLLIALVCYLVNDYTYLDIALAYGLMNFIATTVLLRYVKSGQFHEAQND